MPELKEENLKLKLKISNLTNEIEEIKRQKNIDDNILNSERNKFNNEIIINNNRNNLNIEREKNLKEEISNIKLFNQNMEKENIKMKTKNKIIRNELNKLENLFIHENIEQKQINAIYYYLNNKVLSETKKDDKKFSAMNIFLQEMNYKYGLTIDSDKFKEIALYYIKVKLSEKLTDNKTSKIFSNPVITADGITYEKNIINKSINYIENKLVFKICEILKNCEEKLNLQNLQEIKELLTSKETGEYYKNPVVISSGPNKGNTIEDFEHENIEYKNLLIKNIIIELGELFGDDFFKFEGIKTDDAEEIENFNIIKFNNL